MNTSTSYNTLQSVLQTYHDNYAIPMLRLLLSMQRDRTPESLLAASRIAATEHSSLTQEEADSISEEISDALLLLLQSIEETCEMALELAPNTKTRENLYNY